MFLDFFLIINNNLKKTKQPKIETRRVHKHLKELNQGQVNSIHLREFFLTHIVRVFGFVGENP